ncbi:MAG TPA: FAD-binding oxidoreductase, partial [Candidatus Saccharimonadales bacterium]|nr:FAD-binding oxidoreductase [Candidatus Saccharimonadales bacterium]
MSPLEALKTNINGSVITPDDSSYTTFKNTFFHQGNPAVIVQVKDAEDARHALTYAKEHELTLSLRSGGHSHYSTNNGGMVIDLSLINSIEQLDASTVRIGSGATWGEIATKLQEWGLAISSGDTTSVGVGGLTVGGGVGWMVRKYGLTIDQLLAADIMTADGKLCRASASENEDLFWAIRGGGGNFGIITHFEFQAHATDGVYAGTITYDRKETASILKQW